MTAAIEVSDLRKAYGDNEAVRGISFEVRAGEVFGLLGPNGAGKTTTVEILEGYRKRDTGEVSVLGFDPGRAEQRAREDRVGADAVRGELLAERPRHLAPCRGERAQLVRLARSCLGVADEVDLHPLARINAG